MTINDSTIFTDVWTSVRSLLVSSLPYVTNSTTNATTACSIKADHNDLIPSRPIIIMPPIAMDEDTDIFNSSEGYKVINVYIDCYGASSLQSDQLRNQVCNIIKVNEITGLGLSGVISEPSEPEIRNDNKYFVSKVTATYLRG